MAKKIPSPTIASKMSFTSSETATLSSRAALSEFDSKYNIINIGTPQSTMMSAQFKRSNAYWTVQQVLPVMLTSIIDDLSQSKNEIVKQHGEQAIEEIKTVLSKLSRLKHQLQTDKCFELFAGNEPDKELWNSFLQHLTKETNSFFRSSCLYSEAYVYRKVASFYAATTTLNQYDYFVKKKTHFMTDFPIAEFIRLIRARKRNLETLALLIKISLWSDLEDITFNCRDAKFMKNLFKYIESLDEHILIDEHEGIWKCLQNADRSTPVMLDIVCNNAGFELCTDIILAEFLLDMKLVDSVRFHVKKIPWYIQDVTESDFHSLLDVFCRHSSSYISEQGRKWTQLVNLGKITLAPAHYFWTTPYEFYKMREICPDLYSYLAKSQIVIFKGSLNYRKLLGDVNWEPTTEFITCIRGFQPTNICAVTTLKSELVCGLSSGKYDELHRINSKWLTSGTYSVIQYLRSMTCGCCI